MPELRAKPSTKILQPTLNREEGRVGGEGDFMWLGRFLLSQDAAHTPWICFGKTRLSSGSCTSAMQPIIFDSKSAELLWASRINHVLQLIGWITSQLGHLTLHSRRLIIYTWTASEDSLELPHSSKQSMYMHQWNSHLKFTAKSPLVWISQEITVRWIFPRILHKGQIVTIWQSLIFLFIFTFVKIPSRVDWRIHQKVQVREERRRS